MHVACIFWHFVADVWKYKDYIKVYNVADLTHEPPLELSLGGTLLGLPLDDSRAKAQFLSNTYMVAHLKFFKTADPVTQLYPIYTCTRV